MGDAAVPARVCRLSQSAIAMTMIGFGSSSGRRKGLGSARQLSSPYAGPVPFAPKDELVRVEAPGILLREFQSTDTPDLLAAFADEDIAHWNPGPTGPESAAEFMASRNDWSGNHASWAVADTSDRLIGSVSVHKIDPDQADAEIGYWVAPWARRQGQGTRSVLAASRFAFAQLGLHRVYLYHAVENLGSCGVARAAGFIHEGTLRQSFRYADGAYHDEHLHGLLNSDVGTEGG
jgi:RimJ/RimL family protein N-acetyltransferase